MAGQVKFSFGQEKFESHFSDVQEEKNLLSWLPWCPRVSLPRGKGALLWAFVHILFTKIK